MLGTTWIFGIIQFDQASAIFFSYLFVILNTTQVCFDEQIVFISDFTSLLLFFIFYIETSRNNEVYHDQYDVLLHAT